MNIDEARKENKPKSEKHKCNFCTSEYYGNEFFCHGCMKTIPKLTRLRLQEAMEYWSFYHQIDMNHDSLKTITKYYPPPSRDIMLDYLRVKLVERLSNN